MQGTLVQSDPQTLNEFEAIYNAKDTTDYLAKLNGVLTAVFKEVPSINLILVVGYTPGFNDGDPCYHSQTTAVEGFGISDMYAFFDEDEEDESKKEFEEEHGVKVPERVETYAEDESGNWKSRRLKVGEKKLKRVHTLLENMSDVFEKCFSTDWKIVIKRTGEDTFDLKKDEYNPDY